MVKNVPVPPGDRAKFAISDDEILTARALGLPHRGPLLGEARPAHADGHRMGQGRPHRRAVHRAGAARDGAVAQGSSTSSKPTSSQQRGTVLVTGRSVGEKIATGPVRVIKSAQFIEQFQEGEVLVTDKTDPDWEPIMKKAAAIVTNRGGRTCHAAIVSRELGVPAIVGTEHGTELLKDGQMVTVSCAEGDTGFVYEGELPFDVQRTNLKDLGRPRTKVMMNVGNPEEAFSLSLHPERRRRPRARGVHHHAPTSRSIRWRCSITTSSTTPRRRRRSTSSPPATPTSRSSSSISSRKASR